MKTKLTKKEAEKKINDFFKRSDFTPKEAKKIKRLAMKFNIKLKEKRKKFCKKCLISLKGKMRISKGFRTIECSVCGYKNRQKLSL